MQLNELNERFGIEGIVIFKKQHHTIVAEITTPASSAKVSLYGAQVLSYVPKGEEDLLFVSSESHFQDGKAIRGGIPVCWPWFNAHPDDASLPSHGFARISTWNVQSTMLNNGEFVIEMSLKSSEATKQYFPFDFEAIVEVRVGDQLKVSITTRNTGTESFKVSSALHTYFNISDIETVQLEGLHQTVYKDDVLGLDAIQEEEYLTFNGRIDRRYHKTGRDLKIIDKERNIVVGKTGSQITVVWNPWAELSSSMADLGDQDYRRMLCVESANSLEDTITIAPGQKHCLGTSLFLE